ncbi:Uncharacterized protein Fot_07475 [Forsythia ovata]|uniref:Uncharacterized protein n=1 Tax=Forsythia ovata TaxID=205694 RepID=A0ABD1WVX8_9LAMI
MIQARFGSTAASVAAEKKTHQEFGIFSSRPPKENIMHQLNTTCLPFLIEPLVWARGSGLQAVAIPLLISIGQKHKLHRKRENLIPMREIIISFSASILVADSVSTTALEPR